MVGLVRVRPGLVMLVVGRVCVVLVVVVVVMEEVVVVLGRFLLGADRGWETLRRTSVCLNVALLASIGEVEGVDDGGIDDDEGSVVDGDDDMDEDVDDGDTVCVVDGVVSETGGAGRVSISSSELSRIPAQFCHSSSRMPMSSSCHSKLSSESDSEEASLIGIGVTVAVGRWCCSGVRCCPKVSTPLVSLLLLASGLVVLASSSHSPLSTAVSGL